jgi:hypothetical protein
VAEKLVGSVNEMDDQFRGKRELLPFHNLLRFS